MGICTCYFETRRMDLNSRLKHNNEQHQLKIYFVFISALKINPSTSRHTVEKCRGFLSAAPLRSKYLTNDESGEVSWKGKHTVEYDTPRSGSSIELRRELYIEFTNRAIRPNIHPSRARCLPSNSLL